MSDRLEVLARQLTAGVFLHLQPQHHPTSLVTASTIGNAPMFLFNNKLKSRLICDLACHDKSILHQPVKERTEGHPHTQLFHIYLHKL